MLKIIAATLFAVLACALSVHAMSPSVVAAADAVQPSFDIAMPALQSPPSGHCTTTEAGCSDSLATPESHP